MSALRVLAVLVGLLSSCIAPSVLPPAGRSAVSVDEAAWRPADAADVPGTYVSVEVRGSVAAVLRMVVYLFEPAGTYTGAALVDGTPPSFQVVSGAWELAGEELRLDGGPPARLEVAEGGSLRLTGEEGVVVLRREVER